MQTLRRIIQSAFLVWFVYLFLSAIGHSDSQGNLSPISAAPVDFFLRIDPLIGATAMIAARKIITISLLYALPIVALTVFFGRFFCGWICPLAAYWTPPIISSGENAARQCRTRAIRT